MIILVSGVVLLTYKKPEDKSAGTGHTSATPLTARGHRAGVKGTAVGDEEEALHEGEAGADEAWQLGEASDDEDDQADAHALRSPRRPRRRSTASVASRGPWPHGEGEDERMMADHDEDEIEEGGHRRSSSSDATLAQPSSALLADEVFGAWGSGSGSHGKAQD